jgi:transcriptional regulator GlxA family with amidase domain
MEYECMERKMDRRVERVLQMMHDNSKQFELNKIAGSVNLSVSRLSHLFKANTGLPPAKYFKQLQMERAKQLLATSFLSIKEVKSAVGIHDSSNFVRSFKTVYGLTPTQYRSGAWDPRSGNVSAGMTSGARIQQKQIQRVQEGGSLTRRGVRARA